MVYKIFLDANVTLDFFLKRPGYYKMAELIVRSIIEGRHQAYTSAVVIHIVAHISKKVLGAQQTNKLILALLNDVRVLDTSHEIIVQAMSAGWSDIEDALQYYTALNYKIDLFISRDEGLLKKALPSLPVALPEMFIRLMNDREG
jgi:predicted nucleic acid-binding protein